MKCCLLYLIGQLRPGGQEQQLCHLLHALDRKRYRPVVAVWNYSEHDINLAKIRSLDVPVYPLSSSPSPTTKFLQFRKLVKKLQPEVVHSYSFWTNSIAYMGAKGLRALSIGSVRSDLVRLKKKTGPLIGHLNARWPRQQIYNSFSAARTASSINSFFVPRCIYVVPNGLDLDHYQPTPIQDTPQGVALGVGSLISVKRWDRLLKATFELKRKGHNCFVQIAGDGPLRQSLDQEAHNLDLDGNIEFLGHRDDIPGLLASSLFLVHTSDVEGRSNVVMEAMACGRAVIATDSGDISKMIEDGKTGYIVQRQDDEALVKCMEELFYNRNLCRIMGEAGRAKAEKEFPLSRLAQETLKAYRSAGWKN